MLRPSKSWLLLSLCLSAFGTAHAFGAATCTTDQSLTIPRKRPSDQVKHAYRQSDGSIVFLGSLTVDADGAPKAYGPKNSGLDALANGGHPGNWWALATDAPNCGSQGNPLIQSPDDPAPGYYVSMTAMNNPAVNDCRSPHNYVNSDAIPYVGLSPRIAMLAHGRGKLVAVAPAGGGKPQFAVQADQSPPSGIGEGSMELARRLGLNPNPRHGGMSSREFIYVVLADRMGFPGAAEAVTESAITAFAKWGGVERLDACRKVVQAAPP